MTTTKTKTPFEQAQAQVNAGQLQTPSVSSGGKKINYFGYQLAVHKFNLSIMSKGITCRGIKLKDLKNYYGLKGKTASDCLPQFLEIMDNYTKNLEMNQALCQN